MLGLRLGLGLGLGLALTFYLPPRHHYSDAELAAAYPRISQFWALKAKHDPHGVFDSLWRRRYAPRDGSWALPTPGKPLPPPPAAEQRAAAHEATPSALTLTLTLTLTLILILNPKPNRKPKP